MFDKSKFTKFLEMRAINGSDITIGQTTTDFSGRASIFLNPSVEYSIIAVKDGFNTFTGSLKPSQSEYPIIMTQIGLERFVSAFEDVIYLAGNDFTVGNDFTEPFLIINSIGGSLQYYGLNTTYDSVDYLVNNTDLEYMRWIFDALDGKTTSWISRIGTEAYDRETVKGANP